MVYFSMVVVVGVMWLVLDAADFVSPQTLTALGLLVATGLAGFAFFIGLTVRTLSVVQPGTALVAAPVVILLTWWVVARPAPEAAAAGSLGLLALLGHTLDVLLTTVGVDVPGFGE